jgi:nucleoside-diphosphate-sugar epimerase
VGYDYVEDVARAFVRCAFEVSTAALVADLTGEQATSEEFVQAITAVVPEAADHLDVRGPEIPTNIPPEPHYISRLFPDWEATSLREGVRRTVDFYRPRDRS